MVPDPAMLAALDDFAGEPVPAPAPVCPGPLPDGTCGMAAAQGAAPPPPLAPVDGGGMPPPGLV